MSSLSQSVFHNKVRTLINYEQLTLTHKVGLAIAGSLLLTISAKTLIPFWPVNATIQTLAIMGIGAIYGRRLGFMTVLLYLAEGAVGLPVFTSTPEKGIGLTYMMGPSAGFLLGFPLMAYATGLMVERGWGSTFLKAATTCLVANVVLYIPGMLWLSNLIGFNAAFSNFACWMPGVLTQCGLWIVVTTVISKNK